MTRLETMAASGVKPRAMPMLWRDRIPESTLSVMVGAPGAGKSSLTAMIAAEVSARYPVLISNVEDEPGPVTRPRLEVAGAQLANVHIVPHHAAPEFPRDLSDFADLITRLGVRLAILDPVASHFTPERRVHDRPLLRRIVAMCRATECAILGVHHFTKSGTIGGPSGGLAGVARAVYVYGIDPEDQDRRALATEKTNGFERPPALILTHDVVDYYADGQIIDAGRLRIVSQSNAKAAAVRKTSGKVHRERDEACAEWLVRYLAAGDDFSRPVNDIRRDGIAEGFQWYTLQRASTMHRCEKRPAGYHKGWVWRLPDEHPARQPDVPAAV
jgi:hypothetical protein